MLEKRNLSDVVINEIILRLQNLFFQSALLLSHPSEGPANGVLERVDVRQLLLCVRLHSPRLRHLQRNVFIIYLVYHTIN